MHVHFTGAISLIDLTLLCPLLGIVVQVAKKLKQIYKKICLLRLLSLNSHNSHITKTNLKSMFADWKFDKNVYIMILSPEDNLKSSLCELSTK